LGKRIVEEFGLSDSVDTLGRWMSHRIAELMERAESTVDAVEREAIRRQCSDLIIRLWERRAHWPYGQPLAGVAELLKSLVSDETSYPRQHRHREIDVDSRSWIGVLPLIRKLQDREEDICRNVAIADVDLEAHREWLTQHGTELSEEEREITERLITLRERLEQPYFELDKTRVPNFASLAPTKRTQLAQKALKQINEERKKLLASIQPIDDRLRTQQTARRRRDSSRRVGSRSEPTLRQNETKGPRVKKLGSKQNLRKKTKG
jgi:hypothetical protein